MRGFAGSENELKRSLLYAGQISDGTPVTDVIRAKMLGKQVSDQLGLFSKMIRDSGTAAVSEAVSGGVARKVESLKGKANDLVDEIIDEVSEAAEKVAERAREMTSWAEGEVADAIAKAEGSWTEIRTSVGGRLDEVGSRLMSSLELDPSRGTTSTPSHSSPESSSPPLLGLPRRAGGGTEQVATPAARRGSDGGLGAEVGQEHATGSSGSGGSGGTSRRRSRAFRSVD